MGDRSDPLGRTSHGKGDVLAQVTFVSIEYEQETFPVACAPCIPISEQGCHLNVRI